MLIRRESTLSATPFLAVEKFVASRSRERHIGGRAMGTAAGRRRGPARAHCSARRDVEPSCISATVYGRDETWQPSRYWKQSKRASGITSPKRLKCVDFPQRARCREPTRSWKSLLSAFAPACRCGTTTTAEIMTRTRRRSSFACGARRHRLSAPGPAGCSTQSSSEPISPVPLQDYASAGATAFSKRKRGVYPQMAQMDAD
jgi:hypothetical protein